jgi:hypothetical protein
VYQEFYKALKEQFGDPEMILSATTKRVAIKMANMLVE